MKHILTIAAGASMIVLLWWVGVHSRDNTIPLRYTIDQGAP